MSNHHIDPTEFPQLFRDFFASLAPGGLFSEVLSQSTIPSKETPDAYVTHLELPGFKRDDINVTITHESTEGVELTIAAIRGNRSLMRYVVLGDENHPVDSGLISSKLEDGILTITAPKRKAPKVEPRKINVA